MNGYQLTKQYFAFAAANPGATTPGMCALFMWLVEVNNRSRFTQNFFFNAEDAGYACGMQSRKTVWKYLVQLEVAGLVLVVYKSNNQERPSVLSFWVSGDVLPVAGGSFASSFGSSYGESVARSLDASDGLPAADDYVAGASVTGNELQAARYSDARNSDAQTGMLDLGSNVANNAPRTTKNIVNGHPVESDASSGVWGNWRFYGARFVVEDLPVNAEPHDYAAGLNVQGNDVIDDLQGQGCLDVNGGLSVSKDAIAGARNRSDVSNNSLAKANRSQQIKAEKSQSVCCGVPAKEHPGVVNPATSNSAPATRTSQPAADIPATPTSSSRNQSPRNPQPNSPPPRRVNTASPALAHSYKGLNNPNQKNSVNGAHLGFGMMKQPDLTEVSSFFTEHGYTTSSAEKAWAHYRQANWHDVQGRPVLNWQQKCRTIWFTPENRIPTTQTRFVQ
jgi:hypothetical protein